MREKIALAMPISHKGSNHFGNTVFAKPEKVFEDRACLSAYQTSDLPKVKTKMESGPFLIPFKRSGLKLIESNKLRASR